MPDLRFTPPAPRGPLAGSDRVRFNHFDSQFRPIGELWLDRGECIDPELTGLVMSLLADIPSHAVFAYPSPGPFYRKLAAHLKLNADRLLLTQGSDGAIRSVFETYIEPGDKVLLTQPTYQMYGVYGAAFGADMHFVSYRIENGLPALSAEEMITEIRTIGPKLVGLPFPDNPIGFGFSLEELRAIIEAAGEVGALMLVDEAYYPFHPHTALPLIEEYGHLIVARTFSKAWGMAGIRLGFAAAPPEITTMLHKSRPMIEADGMALDLAGRMLDHEDAVNASIERLVDGRKMFAAAMADLGYGVIDTPCNFVHVDFGEDRAAIETALVGIARYRVFPDPLLGDYLRFTTTTRDLFKPVIDCIAAATKQGATD
ncbi:MAG: aminotransferase class I/II-fold pyridoxal phosphate-dependent enzyme [Rhodospirillales bacterium]|nr:aminotransferase class I/II-fold pyridoxal phosphate-dependent enzyme [Rhodospirillales bacterium]